MIHIPFLDLKKANEPQAEELKQAACKVIDSGRYLHGEQTRLLEDEIAQLCQTKYCVAVSNGLDALRLIFRAYKELGLLHDGDKIIVPANTYVASILAVSDNGLVPVLCEPSYDTLNLDSSRLESLYSPDVKAIMPVHLYGTPCCDQTLVDFATNHNLLIIEDNAQAIGAVSHTPGINGTTVTGGLGHVAALSFYPTKNLGALGDAGAVVTSDPQLAACVKAIANYGSDRRYHNIYKGLNCRIDEIQAAMLRVQLKHLAKETERRQAVASAYDDVIINPLVAKPRIFHDMKQVWHQYVIRCEKRDQLRQFLLDNVIETDIHYATPPHRQPCYNELSNLDLPITDNIANTAISLPIAYPITTQDATYIATIINRFA